MSNRAANERGASVHPKPEFNAELDGVRGLAMAGVVLFHCSPRIASAWYDGLIGSQWMWMDVFFVLSGFLITRNLLDDRDNVHRFRNFYVNRVLRIMPAYLTALFLVFAVLSRNATIAEELEKLPSLWWFLTWGFNFKVAQLDNWPASELMNHFWSLCVEEQFYLLWPLAIYWLPARFLFRFIVLLVLTATVVEAYLVWQHVNWMVVHTSFFTRIDALSLGAGLALFHRSVRRRDFVPTFTWLFYVSSTVLLACALLKGGLRFTGWHSHWIVNPAILVWGTTLVYLLVNAPQQRWAAVFRLRPLIFLGRYSYAVYIYHWLIFVIVIQVDAFGMRSSNGWINLGTTVALTAAATTLSNYLVEKPALRRKLRSFQARAESVPASPAGRSVAEVGTVE